MTHKIFKILAAVLIIFVFFPFAAFAQVPGGFVDPAFNPNLIIPDSAFNDTQTFGGPVGIQEFLQTKGSILADTTPAFLDMLKEPDVTLLKQGLDDPEPDLSQKRTAAQLIWDAAQSSGLNPQVILVTLNKEQGLITSSQSLTGAALQTALDHAMGFDCPDGTGCGNLFPGFYYQLFGNFDSSGNRYLGAAKSLMKSFNTPGGRGPDDGNGNPTQVGSYITLQNSMGGYTGINPVQSVELGNLATAALYRFTPHVFNGNYNFWLYFTSWFKYPNGTLLKLANATDTYIIQNGLKQLVPPFVAQARGLNLASTITVSPTEFSNYQTDVVLGPTDNTVVQVSGQTTKYVFINNVAHQASDLVIKQRGLATSTPLSVSASDLALFQTGSVLPPNDGTIIKGTISPAVYLVQNGDIKLFSAYTFAQHKVTAKQIVTVPDAEIASYTQNGFVPPVDGSLVKSSSDPTIYLVSAGLKEPVLGDVFKNQGYSYYNVGTISGGEIAALPTGSYAPPKDYTFFAVDSKTGPLYDFKEGTIHSISAFVAKQRGITPDYVFSNNVVSQWYTGIPVPPRDGTVVEGDDKSDQTIYLVQNGQLDPLTYTAFKDRYIRQSQINILPELEVLAYAKGSAITK
jgi:hypothetical protein